MKTNEVVLRRITPEGLRALAGLLPMDRNGKRPAAAGVKFPWVGIPIPGKRPAMVVNREKLRAILQGTTLDGVAVVELRANRDPQHGGCGAFIRDGYMGGLWQAWHCGQPPKYKDGSSSRFGVEYCIHCDDKRAKAPLPAGLQLKVWASAPGRERPIQCNYTFVDQREKLLDWWTRGSGRDWAEKQRGKRAQQPQQPQTLQGKRERAQERRLQEGLDKVRKQRAKHVGRGDWKPQCMFLGHEADLTRFATDRSRGEELDWKREKPARRKLGWHIAHARQESKTNQEVYRTLGMLGYNLKQWGQLNTAERRQFSELESVYWKQAYQLQGSGCNARKPYRHSMCSWTIRGKYPTPAHEANYQAERVAEHRRQLVEHAEWLRVKKQFDNTIQSLEEELAAFRDGIKNKHGVCEDCGSPLELQQDAEEIIGKGLWCPSCESFQNYPEEADHAGN